MLMHSLNLTSSWLSSTNLDNAPLRRVSRAHEDNMKAALSLLCPFEQYPVAGVVATATPYF
jgi:hypothetical protein